MAPKNIQKFLASDCQGIDGQSSALQDNDNFINVGQNYEMSVGNSLRGRVGCQTSGSYGFFAIFPYRYTRTQDQYDIVYQTAAGTYPNQTASLATSKTSADGASIEKLIGINQQVWVLDTMNITITQTNAGVYTWYTYVNASDINFRIKKDAVTIATIDLNDGVTTAGTSIWSLLDSIDALSDLAVSRTTRGTCPPFAIVDGNQTTSAQTDPAYGDRWRITVDSGHNFSAGDIISFVPSGTDILYGGFVIATTSTTIDYIGLQATLDDNQVLGYMAQSAAMFPISTASSETSGSFIISFPYWRLIPEGDKSFGQIYVGAKVLHVNKTANSFYAPAVAENALGNLYIAASSAFSSITSGCNNNLVALDGLQPRRAGLPAPTVVQNVSGSGSLTGTFRYKAFLRRYDGQGNIWDGPVSDYVTQVYSSNYGVLGIAPPQYSDVTGFQVRGCYKHTNESPASGAAFYVDDSTGGVGNEAFIQPGDVICLTDNTAQTTGLWTNSGLSVPVGTLHVTRCTAYSASATTISPTTSSIKVEDSSGYQINADTEISTGLTAVLLRTTNGGNQYYVLCEIPVNGLGGPVVYDNVSDATLQGKEQFLEPEIGKEHNPPPMCTLVCQHQGGLVVARGQTSPNTVAVSTAEGLEYFPTASNSFDVPSTQAGSITAIASDTADRLAVFKERAYYDVIGDVDAGNFAVETRNEGDFGITSQASLVRLPFGLTGLSKNGFVVIQDGLLDYFRFAEQNARIVNQKYQFAWATAVNDYFNRSYICTIPQITGEPVGFTIDYARPVIKSLERSYPTKIDQAGGCAMIGDTLYHLSATSPYGVFRRLYRFNGDSPHLGNGDSFIDNTNAIEYILELVPQTGGLPEVLKSYVRVRIYSIPNDYVVEGWVPFSMAVTTGISAFQTYIGGSSPGATSSTITFSDNSVEYKDIKVTREKHHFYMIRMTTNTIRTSPFFTGIALMMSENYKPEDFIR